MASISVAGFASCPFHQRALAAAHKMVEMEKFSGLDDLTFASRDLYQAWLKADKPSFEDGRAATHTSSPFVFSGETFIGGCDDTLALLAESEAGRCGCAATRRRLRAVSSHLSGSSSAPMPQVEPTAAQPGTDEDEAKVRAVLQDYIDGTFEGDIVKLKNCFHPDAIMNGYIGEKLQEGTPEPFFDGISKGKPFNESDFADRVTGKIAFVHVAGLCASAAVEETGYAGMLSFTDYFHLAKTASGVWKIYSKCARAPYDILAPLRLL